MILIFLDIFRQGERLYPSESVRVSNNKVSLGLKNKQLIEKLLVMECRDCDVKVRNF